MAMVMKENRNESGEINESEENGESLKKQRIENNHGEKCNNAKYPAANRRHGVSAKT